MPLVISFPVPSFKSVSPTRFPAAVLFLKPFSVKIKMEHEGRHAGPCRESQHLGTEAGAAQV